MINGTTVATDISFPSTGSWTTWSTVSFIATVSAGTNTVRLEATGTSGLSNIDCISITGNNPQAVDCSALLKNSEISVTLSETEGIDALNVFPNPFSTTATISFKLSSSQNISQRLYDLTRIIREFNTERYQCFEC